MYPSLAGIFGQPYIEKLLSDHDGAIAGARRLVELAGSEKLRDEEVAEADNLIRGILPHVSDCEGLSLMVERLPDDRVESILDARAGALRAGLDLLRWASEIRARPSTRATPA